MIFVLNNGTDFRSWRLQCSIHSSVCQYCRRVVEERVGDIKDSCAPAGALALAEERPVYLIPFYRGAIGVANRLRRLADQ